MIYSGETINVESKITAGCGAAYNGRAEFLGISNRVLYIIPADERYASNDGKKIGLAIPLENIHLISFVRPLQEVRISPK